MSSDTDCEEQEIVLRKKKFKHRRKCRKENCTQDGRKNEALLPVPVRCTRRCCSDFITQQRLTRRLGIYCKGKKSNTVTRKCELEMSEETKARTQQDLNRILDFWAEKTLNSAKVNNSRSDLSSRLHCEKNSNEKLHRSDSTSNSFQSVVVTPAEVESTASSSMLTPITPTNPPLKEIIEKFQKVLSKTCDQYFSQESIQERIKKKLIQIYRANKFQENSSQTNSQTSDYSQDKYQINGNTSFPASCKKVLLKSNNMDCNNDYQDYCYSKTDNEENSKLCPANSQFLQSESALPAFSNFKVDKSDIAIRLDWLDSLEQSFPSPAMTPEAIKFCEASTFTDLSSETPIWENIQLSSPLHPPSSSPTPTWKYPRQKLF